MSSDERKLLASRPAQGTGLHPWIFRAVCTLMRRHSADNTRAIMIAATTDCERETRREIDDAIRHVRGNPKRAGSPAGQAKKRSQRSERDDVQIQRVLRSGFGQVALRASTPYPLDPGAALNVPNLLRHLFPDDPLLCLGWNECRFATMPQSEWCDRTASGTPPQFIVPNPMSKLRGLTRDGKLSAKSNDNTGPRRFLVVEFDFKPHHNARDAALLAYGTQFGLFTTLDLCASLLAELARFAPLVLVVWSGGKSLQGWFPMAGVSELVAEQFFRRACALGADPATWSKSQFVRLPCGRRDNGEIQSVNYFNPGVPVL